MPLSSVSKQVSIPRAMLRPWFLCSLATLVGIPVWFFSLVAAMSAGRSIDCPAGFVVYFLLCLASSVIVVPVNAFVVSPLSARCSFRSIAGALALHVCAGVATYVAALYWPSVIARAPALGWTILPYYMAMFLLPPMILGSLVYSLRSCFAPRQPRGDLRAGSR